MPTKDRCDLSPSTRECWMILALLDHQHGKTLFSVSEFTSAGHAPRLLGWGVVRTSLDDFHEDSIISISSSVFPLVSGTTSLTNTMLNADSMRYARKSP